MAFERADAPALNASFVIQTAGTRLDDGSFLEPVLPYGSYDLELAHISPTGKLLAQAKKIAVGCCTYKPLELSTATSNAICWPSNFIEGSASDAIHDELCRVFQLSGGWDPIASTALTCFAIGTWFTDVLPQAPILIIENSSPSTKTRAIELLRQVCRHAVITARVSGIPGEIYSTAILPSAPMTKAEQRLVAHSSLPMYRHARGKELVNLYSAKAIFCEYDDHLKFLEDYAIRVDISESGEISRATEVNALVLQNQLLSFRIRNTGAVQAVVEEDGIQPHLLPFYAHAPSAMREILSTLLEQSEEDSSWPAEPNRAVLLALRQLVETTTAKVIYISQICERASEITRAYGGPPISAVQAGRTLARFDRHKGRHGTEGTFMRVSQALEADLRAFGIDGNQLQVQEVNEV